MTTYGPLLGGLRSLGSDRLWARGRKKAAAPAALPFGKLQPPLRKELPADLLEEDESRLGLPQSSRPLPPVAEDKPITDHDAVFLLDFEAPFLRAISKVASPSDHVFRERAVYWDLRPARSVYGKILYRQNSFFVNRKQDVGLGVNLSSVG